MSATRPPRHVSGSTARLVQRLHLRAVEGIITRHYGFTRRDIAQGRLSLERKWVALPSEREVAL
jgi:hypothetical protein